MKAEIKETDRWVRGNKNICSRKLKVVDWMKAEIKETVRWEYGEGGAEEYL
jgi:hypothetical protein